MKNKLSECTDTQFLRDECERLWQMLDNIDTAFDMYKPAKSSFSEYIDKECQKRFNKIDSDGYDLFVNEENKL